MPSACLSKMVLCPFVGLSIRYLHLLNSFYLGAYTDIRNRVRFCLFHQTCSIFVVQVGETPLHCAASRGFLDLAKFLLQRSSGPSQSAQDLTNSRDKVSVLQPFILPVLMCFFQNGRSPVFCASESGMGRVALAIDAQSEVLRVAS